MRRDRFSEAVGVVAVGATLIFATLLLLEWHIANADMTQIEMVR